MRGLSGIPLRRGGFLRPLLRFTMRELLAYAAAHDIAYREDPSNELLNYARNRIRRIVVPALEQVQPRASENIRKLARHAARTETAWRSVLALLADDLVVARDERALELARPVLLEYHPELRARVVRHLLRRFGITPGRMQTRQLVEFCERAASGARVALARRVSLERAFDRIRIVRVPDSGAPDSILPVSGPAGEGAVNLGGRRYDVAWHVSGSRAGDEVFDAALLDAGLEFRAWRAGDRIRLPYGGKKLKKLFGERRIAASERARIPVLSDIRGRVFWVVGVARSVDALPGDGAPGLNITVRHAESR
ncbi:MAG: tRNA lysidine(34) synthetase TilS, partial [Gemmatimonadota bacterium]